MSEYHDIKNKDITDILKDLTEDDITEIHENFKPSYLLRSIMLGAMVDMDLKVDWNYVSTCTRDPKSFIQSLKLIDYEYVTLNHLKQLHLYTKSKKLFDPIAGLVPSNLILIYSLGSKNDNLIDLNKDRHAKIFNSLNQLNSEGYINASDNDLLAITDNKKVGLLIH